jgi:hypothetical protein
MAQPFKAYSILQFVSANMADFITPPDLDDVPQDVLDTYAAEGFTSPQWVCSGTAAATYRSGYFVLWVLQPEAVDILASLAEEPFERVIAIFGDSNFAGFGPSAENATGFRSTLNRILNENGIQFRMIGQGYWGLNGAGSLWGRVHTIDDLHDHPVPLISDTRQWAFGGRKLVESNVVTAINATTNTLTVPGHNLAVGVVCTLDFSGTTDPPVLAVVQPVYYCASVSGNDITLGQFEGSTTPIDVTHAGTGVVRLNEGIIDMLPALFAASDAAPTDIIAGGGTNDVTALITQGLSVADALAILQERELAYEAKLNELAPQANIHRVCLLDYNDDTPSAIAASAVALQFNAWLVARAASLGRRWTVVEATSRIPKSAYADIVHLSHVGYELYGEEIGRSLVQSIGPGLPSARVPRPFVPRPAQACVELRATSDRCAFPAQTALNPGGNSFFFAVRFMPFALPAGTNVIVQQETPYQSGCMLTANAARLNLYHLSAGTGTVIAHNAHTACLQVFRWHDLFVFFDTVRKQVALICNGQLLQRTTIGDTVVITSQDGWSLGGIPSLLSALGLYQHFLVGHGAGLTVEHALKMARGIHYDNVDPKGTTYKALLAEGTGTVLASTVPDTTAGTLTGGVWVASGKYKTRATYGHIEPRFDSRNANVTAAYTATYRERVPCDPTAGGFTVALPTAVGHDGEQVAINNMSASTNTITVSGAVAAASITTAYGFLCFEARNGSWYPV